MSTACDTILHYKARQKCHQVHVPHKKVCHKFGGQYLMLLAFQHVLKHMLGVPVRKEKSIKQYLKSFDVVCIAPFCPNVSSVYTVFSLVRNKNSKNVRE